MGFTEQPKIFLRDDVNHIDNILTIFYVVIDPSGVKPY